MPGSANVQSSESIEAVKGVLIAFGEHVEDAITMLDSELRRLFDWLEDDCPRYWKRQVHESHEGVTRAQAELHRCLMFPVADERPSCREERAALKRAQARLAYCQQKQEIVRNWIYEK